MAQPISPVVYADGRYALVDGAGTLYFSSDLKAWEKLTFEPGTKLRWVRHDGEQWVLASSERKLALSADLKTWTPWFTSDAANETAVLWRGRYWRSAYTVLGITQFMHELGRYDQERDEKLKEWDAQVRDPNMPAVYWRQGDRLRVIRRDGLHYVTENGEYWSITGGHSVNDAREVLAAEGNGRAVVSVVGKDNQGAGPLITVQEGTAFPDRVETPFTQVLGLAYGAGRFVMLATTADDPRSGLFESADGRTWTPVGERQPYAKGLVHGPAGFATQTKEALVVYAPEPWPEQSAMAWEPVEMPVFRLTDYGTNFVGVGKKRREIPKTPEQIRSDELRPTLVAAQKGDVAAGVQMGLLMLEGKYVDSNPWRAEVAFQAGIAAGIAEAPRGYAELLSRWKPGTPRLELLRLYRQSAELGDVPAMVWLALNLEPDSDSARSEIARWRDGALAADPLFAARWAKRETFAANIAAAQSGDVDAMAKVLPIALDGDIMPADWSLAIALADRAAEGGNHDVAGYLLQRYQANRQGYSHVSPYPEAEYKRLLERGVAANHKLSLALYLESLMTGRFGYERDEEQALARARQLADQGDADGMFFVAMILQNRQDAPKDPVAAAEWMQKAADAGHVQAAAWLKTQQLKASPQ
ncbi:tetratricopeptide repeat protein [Actomonas aquatica]|uniref:Sel1 repeat family protein n=1 Tax=Actomonas aquatica TaxID=2866162 RepID=A0ABZ1C7N3_9BACT|nr:hypothetical protein [Opitutus sp. WL0086]WRQ87278.1 hypothetical protein K1X11_020895 [Opitutus sp. WL0086]